MMKIGIITVYQTENTGSILQATALKDVLVERGCKVKFVSTKNKYSAHSALRLALNFKNSVINRQNPLEALKKYCYYSNYIHSVFESTSPEAVLDEHFDALIIGSDTVWDMNSRYFRSLYRTFWALDWEKIPTISYAATIANTAYEDLDELCYPQIALRRYHDISVRDRYTAQYVESRTGREAQVVCDPTLLHPVEYYKKQCVLIRQKFLLLYLFDDPGADVIHELVAFAHRRGLAVICLGKYISGSDQWVSSTVEEFLSYYNSAEFVVTNTFHGTIFSILFHKQFVVLDYGKRKIAELLREFSLSERLTASNPAVVLEHAICYEAVDKVLDETREQSLNYLCHALKLGEQ